MSMGADAKANAWGSGILEAGDLRLLEDGSERSGALSSNADAYKTASEGRSGTSERVGVSTGTDTKLGSGFKLQAAYSSDCSVVLPLRPSARAAPPWGPSPLTERLRAWERVRVLRVSMGADTKANTWGAGSRGGRPTPASAAWCCPSGPRREQLLLGDRVC